MPEAVPYASAKAVDDAIKQAARNAAADASVSVTDRIRQAYFDRFLCRVFSGASQGGRTSTIVTCRGSTSASTFSSGHSSFGTRCSAHRRMRCRSVSGIGTGSRSV
jgi:hypothetical protein